MAGRGRAKRAGKVSLAGRKTPKSNRRSVYRGGNKSVGGGTKSKLPIGPNKNGRRAQRVNSAKRGK